jgi:tetratricopeptide (TPR) repeat protein
MKLLFRVSARVPLVLVITFSIFVLFSSSAWPDNLWSLSYLDMIIKNPSSRKHYPVPPEYHRSAAIWLARQALEQGDISFAQDLVDKHSLKEDPQALYILGEIYEAQGDFSSAIEKWKAAKNAFVLRQAGDRANKVGRQMDAFLAYQAAYELEPEAYTATLAFFLWKSQHKPNRAVEILRKSLTDYPDSPLRESWLRRLGEILRIQERWREAEQTYAQLLEENPKSIIGHIGLGWIYYEGRDEFDGAMNEFQKSIDLSPSDGDGYFAKGEILARENRFSEADLYFRKALALEPENSWWYIVRGNTAVAANNLDMALGIYQAAINRFPDYAQAYYEISWVFRLRNRPEKAVEFIEKALEKMAPPNQWFYVRAGQINEWAGNDDKALFAYHRALEIDSNNVFAQRGIAKLRVGGE